MNFFLRSSVAAVSSFVGDLFLLILVPLFRLECAFLHLFASSLPTNFCEQNLLPSFCLLISLPQVIHCLLLSVYSGILGILLINLLVLLLSSLTVDILLINSVLVLLLPHKN